MTSPAWGIPAAPIAAAVAVILSKKYSLSYFLKPEFPFKIPDSHDISYGQRNSSDLSNEDSSNCFIQRRSVHVNRSLVWKERHIKNQKMKYFGLSSYPNRNDKSRDSRIDLILLFKALERNRQSSRTGKRIFMPLFRVLFSFKIYLEAVAKAVM